ncbi:MAG: hypothetical protein J2P21_33840 [Chloracidobacterium sp.]|nr:hypothetical protein [Chloracidobacterium sp.]
MYEAIPKAALWVIPNGGRGPIFGEHTGGGETTKHLAEAVLKFFSA